MNFCFFFTGEGTHSPAPHSLPFLSSSPLVSSSSSSLDVTSFSRSSPSKLINSCRQRLLFPLPANSLAADVCSHVDETASLYARCFPHSGLFHRVITHSAAAHAAAACTSGSSPAKYAREVAHFLSCPADAKKLSQAVECLRRKSVSELLAADSFFLVVNGTTRLQSPVTPRGVVGEDSLAPSSSTHASLNSTASADKSHRQQPIDPSSKVAQQHPGHWSEESSSPATDSNFLGIVSSTSAVAANKSRGVTSQSRNPGSSQAAKGYTTALLIIVIGITFLLLNILLLLREFYKRERQAPQTGTRAKPPSSRDSSPTASQVGPARLKLLA